MAQSSITNSLKAVEESSLNDIFCLNGLRIPVEGLLQITR